MVSKFDLLKLDIVYVESEFVKILLLILNCILPGWGSMINSFMGDKFHKITFFVGLVQFLTCILIVGWIWSIYWGCLILKKKDIGGLIDKLDG